MRILLLVVGILTVGMSTSLACTGRFSKGHDNEYWESSANASQRQVVSSNNLTSTSTTVDELVTHVDQDDVSSALASVNTLVDMATNTESKYYNQDDVSVKLEMLYRLADLLQFNNKEEILEFFSSLHSKL